MDNTTSVHGVIINGAFEAVPGVPVVSWRDEPLLQLGADDKRARGTRWIRGICLHTTKGIPGGQDMRPQKILPGLGPYTDAGEKCARLWSTDGRHAGAHLVVDHDGTVCCLADLLLDAAYHAGPVNEVTIGIEIYQGGGAELYDGQLERVVQLVDWLTARFGIQRQTPPVAQRGVIARIALGAEDVVGVYGHRHVTENRGPGDPGDAVFEHLVAAGYEQLDFGAGIDMVAWKPRQKEVGVPDVDGIPGPRTVVALRAAGHVDGIYVRRPGLVG